MDKKNQHKKVGPIIASMIIIVILVVAAIYVFASRINQQAAFNKQLDDALKVDGTTTSRTIIIQKIQGTSTDPAVLQSDLEKATAGLDF